MVDFITIETNKNCTGSFSCEHLCKIKLVDGREKDIRLFSLNISSLIDQIESHKIKGDFNHFKGLKPYHISHNKHCLNTLYTIFYKNQVEN